MYSSDLGDTGGSRNGFSQSYPRVLELSGKMSTPSEPSQCLVPGISLLSVLPVLPRVHITGCGELVSSDQKQLGLGGAFIGFLLSSHHPSSRVVRAGTQIGARSRNHVGRLLAGFCLVSSLCSPEPPAQGMLLPTVGWVLLHQL